MKIVLKDEVDNLGLAGDIVDVADGYARNFLIPSGRAIRATDGAVREAEAMTKARKVKEAKTIDSARAMAAQIEAKVIKVPARVDEGGRLYGSIGVSDIAAVLKQRGHRVERKRIDLRGTIKQIGTFEVPVRVHPQVTATATIEVSDAEGKVLVREGRVRTLEDISIEEQALRAAEELEQMAAQIVDGELQAEAPSEVTNEAALEGETGGWSSDEAVEGEVAPAADED